MNLMGSIWWSWNAGTEWVWEKYHPRLHLSHTTEPTHTHAHGHAHTHAHTAASWGDKDAVSPDGVFMLLLHVVKWKWLEGNKKWSQAKREMGEGRNERQNRKGWTSGGEGEECRVIIIYGMQRCKGEKRGDCCMNIWLIVLWYTQGHWLCHIWTSFSWAVELRWILCCPI